MGIIKTFINKSLLLGRLGTEWLNKLTSSLVESARTISYVETISPSQTDTFHKSIKWNDTKIFIKQYETIVRWALPKLKLKNQHVKLGVDVTEDFTWTKHGVHNTRASTHDGKHHIESWQYLNVSIITPFFLPLMSLPYRQIDDLDTLVIDLLKYIQTLPLMIDLILFDRGFYHAYLIDFLENCRGGNPLPYLIFARKTEAVKGYIEQTKHFEVFNHQFEYSRDGSKWKPSAKIIVWKPDPEVHPDIALPFATNQKPTQELLDSYPKRWNIETCFRVHDEARIKSKSNNPLIRFFYHLVGMLMVLLWRIQSVGDKHFVFKRYLKSVEYKYYQFIQKPEPPPSVIVY